MLYADETMVWRFALLQRGGARRTQRYRLPTRPLSPGHLKRAEALTRQVWTPHRTWSRLRRGVLRHVSGAVPYGTSKVFYNIVPHLDAQDLRHSIPQGMAVCRPTEKEVVLVVDRRGIHRAHKLDPTLAHDHGLLRCHCFPAHCGHHLHPIAGFWRAMKDAIGAGRCLSELQRLYQRTRHVLMAHQERPIYAFRW